ncbi:MAG: sterol desaturase family protein [Candidatus Dadabacteria bacterium]|nr:MAG: sterol desaturase family protein [Candidatus Dadabacteria bacterium]
MYISPKFISEVLFLALLIFLEWSFPFFDQKREKILHDLRNLVLALINGVIGSVIFSSLIVAVVRWSDRSGHGILASIPEGGAAHLIAAFLLFDLWMYTWHVINHLVPFLWRFHRVHHSDPAMDASTGLRFHPGEIILSYCARLIIIPVIGIKYSELVTYEAVLVAVILFHHSNVALPEYMDKILRSVIVSPRMHRVHHSDIMVETNSNYSSIFSWWDRIFGTYRYRENMKTLRFGLKEYNSSRDQELISLFAAPFRNPDKNRKQD